jgi:Domain of unknown function (DUF4266)
VNPRNLGRAAARLAGAASIMALTGLAGCAGLYQPPQAWEKGMLAKPEMTMGGDALDNQFSQHAYGSKEGSSGGSGVGGGGCGCN